MISEMSFLKDLHYLLIYADKIEEIKTICWCGRKATMIARVADGKIVRSGEQIVIGGNEMYVSLCGSIIMTAA